MHPASSSIGIKRQPFDEAALGHRVGETARKARFKALVIYHVRGSAGRG